LNYIFDSYFLLELLDRNCPAKKEITLRVGAQVILLKNLNIEKELVNGARGMIIGFQAEDEGSGKLYPVVQFAKIRYE
jgi:ATP-dependent DNA helicase PIF1